jgi:Zn-dependent protease
MTQEQLVLLPLWYAMFLLSVTCHEAAHAFAALRGGDPTAYGEGQVTLNPLPHIRREPLGTVAVPLMTFLWMGWMMGWASAPYDPYWEARHPRRAAAMAAAGPLANLLLAACGFAVLKLGLLSGWWSAPTTPFIEYDRLVQPLSANGGALECFGRLCSILLVLNLLLFVFNLIPVPPLDGASVLGGLSARARRLLDALRASPGGAMIGLLAAWAVVGRLFGAVFGMVLPWLYGF